jgi:hypothetical protein
MIYQRQRPNQSSLPPFPIKVKTHGVHFNHDQFTCTGISQALEVDTMFFNGSARVQLWLGYPDKFYDSNKNLALDVRHEACL